MKQNQNSGNLGPGQNWVGAHRKSAKNDIYTTFQLEIIDIVAFVTYFFVICVIVSVFRNEKNLVPKFYEIWGPFFLDFNMLEIPKLTNLEGLNCTVPTLLTLTSDEDCQFNTLTCHNHDQMIRHSNWRRTYEQNGSDVYANQ